MPEKVFLREALFHCFDMKKICRRSSHFDEHALAGQTWLAKFKSRDFGLEDGERPGRKKV